MRLQALIGATLLALAAGATFAWSPPPREPPSRPGLPDAEQLADFQAQAEQACRCARTRAGESEKKDCWKGFERAVAPWPHRDYGTMCEFSVEGICFGDDFEACVGKSWSGPVGGPGAICTAEEARTAEAVFMDAFERYQRDKKAEPPDQALRRTLAAFARNDRYARRESEGGCGGG